MLSPETPKTGVSQPTEGVIIAVTGSPGPWSGIRADIAVDHAGNPVQYPGAAPSNKGPGDDLTDVIVNVGDSVRIHWIGDVPQFQFPWAYRLTDCEALTFVRPVTPGLAQPFLPVPGGSA